MEKDIKNDLLDMFNDLLSRFPMINIQYEYSKKFGCFLASVDVRGLDDQALDVFSDLYISLIKDLQEKYGESAPLFSVNEDLFSLSSDATTYCPLSSEFNIDFRWEGLNEFKYSFANEEDDIFGGNLKEYSFCA